MNRSHSGSILALTGTCSTGNQRHQLLGRNGCTPRRWRFDRGLVLRGPDATLHFFLRYVLSAWTTKATDPEGLGWFDGHARLRPDI